MASDQSGTPSLILLFTTDCYDQNTVVSSVTETTGNLPLAGSCVAGIVTPEGVLTSGVGAVTFAGDELSAVTHIEKNLNLEPGQVGQNTGEALLASGIPKGLVLLFPDGFQSNISLALRKIYNTMGPDFTFAGGGAGDNLKFFNTFQFTEKEVSNDSMAAALLSGMEYAVGIGHGWKPRGEPLLITKASGKRVYEINGLPAFEAYRKSLGNVSPEDFSRVGMSHPIGFPDIKGNYLIRDPMKLNKDGSIDFVTETPVNALGSIMEASLENIQNTAVSKVKSAVESVSSPELLLFFNCVSRYLLMGDDFSKEVKGIFDSASGVPSLGILTFGEIGSYMDVPMLHNKTVVALACGSIDNG